MLVLYRHQPDATHRPFLWQALATMILCHQLLSHKRTSSRNGYARVCCGASKTNIGPKGERESDQVAGALQQVECNKAPTLAPDAAKLL